MLYEGNVGIHELLTIDGFADWVLDKTDDFLERPLGELVAMFRATRENTRDVRG